MSKAKELLEKMDAEILEKVNAIVLKEDAAIKARAEEAYNASVEASVAKIKEGVDAEYSVAREYLTEIINAEEPVEEGEKASEETIQSSAEQVDEKVADEAMPNEPVVLG